MAGTPESKDLSGLETRCSAGSLYQNQLDPQIPSSPPIAKQVSLSDHQRRLELYSPEMLSQRDVD